MPVPTLVTDLSTTVASNSPAGSDNVFPDLDNYLRALSAFMASIRDNSGNGWVSPYLPLAGGTVSGGVIFSSTVALNGALSGTGLTTYLASPPAIGGTTPAAVSSTNLSYTGTLTGGTGVVNLGSGQVYKDASGNVGIGTASPGAKLEVYQAANNVLRVGAAATSTAGINFNAAGGTYNTTSFLIQQNAAQTAQLLNYAAQPMTFGTSGTEMMRLDASGNLGIGTTPGQTLDVAAANASFRLTSTTGTNGAFLKTVNTGGLGYIGLDNSSPAFGSQYALTLWHTGAYNIIFGNSNTERMRLDSSGNLGLGVTPSAWGALFRAIDIGNSTAIWRGDSAELAIGQNVYRTATQAIYKNTAAASFYDQFTGQHRWWTAPSGTAGTAITSFTQAMTLDASGNLGIGTSSPTLLLQIGSRGGMSTSGIFQWGQALTGNNRGVLSWDVNKAIIGTPQNLVFCTNSETTERMTLDSSGNLGIGTSSPAQILDIVKSQNASTGAVVRNANTGASASAQFVVNADTTTGRFSAYSSGAGALANMLTIEQTTNNPISFYINSSEQMRLTSTGLGIGTSSLAEKLAVGQGNIYALRTGGAKVRLADQNNEVSVESSPTGGASNMIFKTATATQMTLDSSGNLGLGVTPAAWGGGYRGFDLGTYGRLYSANGGWTGYAANAYYNGTNWIYINSTVASRYEQPLDATIAHAWYTAPVGTATATVNFVERVRIDANGNLLAVSAALGYGTGSGGAATQITSRTTGVTLNKSNGAVTLVSAAGTTAWQSFTVTNSTVAATDVVRVCQKSGTDKYQVHVTAVSAGSFEITFATTGGTTTEQPVFNFAVIKAVTA